MWVAINLGVRFSTRIFTIGLLVHYLSVAEVAAWYVFIALFGLVSLAEAGLGRVVTRQVAERFRATASLEFKYCDLVYLSTILKFYFIILVVLSLIAFLVGLWWFASHIEPTNVPWLNMAWMAFVFANGISLYSALNSAILQGLGEVSLSQKNETIASFINLLVFVAFALVNASLLAPAVALVASTTVSLLLNRSSLRKVVARLGGFILNVRFRYMKAISARIGSELGKYFFMLLSFHLLTSAFVLMLSHYEKASVVASYGITMQMITLVLTFANIWLTSSFPKMAALKGSEKNHKLKELFISVALRGISVLMLGMIAIALIGGFTLNFIGSQIELLSIDILYILMFSIATEYIVFTLLGQLLISQSIMRFTYYSIVGSFIISFTAFFLLELGYGVTVIFIARIIIFMTIISIPIIKDVTHLFNAQIEHSVQ